MPKFPRRRFRGKPYSHGGARRRQLFKPHQNRLPARQQFADQIGGYALNKGDTTHTSLKVFLDPTALDIGSLTSPGYSGDFAIQLAPQLSNYGAVNSEYRLITSAWQRYRVTGATIFVGQPYLAPAQAGTPRTYIDSTVYLAVLKKQVNGRLTTATLRGLENCEFKLMTSSNDVMRKRMKFPAVEVNTSASKTISGGNAFKNMWIQTTDDGAQVHWYSFMIGVNFVNAQQIPANTAIYIDHQIQLELTLDRPNYQNNNISMINVSDPTQCDLDAIEAAYEKHFGKPQPSCTLEIESEDEPEEPLCKRLLGPAPMKPRARAQSE